MTALHPPGPLGAGRTDRSLRKDDLDTAFLA